MALMPYLYFPNHMTPTNKRYRNWTFKSLLIAVYFFLFAVQVNCRFYSIANFYVYAHCQAGTVKNAIVHAEAKALPRFHLSLDKRYSLRHGVKGLACRVQPAISPDRVLIRGSYFSFDEALVPAEPGTLSLRGPPCA